MQADTTGLTLLNSAQVADYYRDGFLVVRNFFGAEELRPLADAYDADPTINGRLYGMVDLEGKGHPFCTWVELGDDIIGLIPRMQRMVRSAEDLLGEPCYHWHSKFSIKTRGCEARVDWHQDYTSWYDDGVLFPHMLTTAIAVKPVTRANGCVQFVPGSHRMGRIGAISMVNPNMDDLFRRVDIAKRELGVYHAEMDVGDAVFFHCNTLHGSDLNSTDTARVMIFSSYNAAANAPRAGLRGSNDEGAFMNISDEERAFRPIDRVPDDVLLKRAYRSAFSHTRFNDPVYDLEGPYSKAIKLSDAALR
ncbi:MAG: phytanoyl-CoA dioxygenase family protein [Gammaproteobacteria bacterium]|nr:phytanoyl-CoA dioxygenase family protein [Gammaproteobacteria bacterium]MDH4254648.1 phytanoyl-CoA dioxygenase family protein [Gammaproteobacteria bacterium]MDH5308331.1 phytanoyl-CoA dioxygenase family protein [Gammaproteobacteria bacterium]